MKVIRALRVVIFAAVLALTPFSASAQDSETRDAIVELLELTGADQLMDQMFALMMPQIISVVRAANPDIPEEILLDLQKRGADEFHKSMPEFNDLMVDLYLRYFTEQEILDLIAFYETPTGRKTISVMPSLMQESMVLGSAFGRTVGERVAKEILSEVVE